MRNLFVLLFSLQSLMAFATQRSVVDQASWETQYAASVTSDTLNVTNSSANTIVLSNGTYAKSLFIKLNSVGTVTDSIFFSAATPGGAVFSGYTEFYINGQYISFKGIYCNNNTLWENGAIYLGSGSRHNLVANCSINNGTANTDPHKYITVDGYNNEVKYCTFTNKVTKGVMMQIIARDYSEHNIHNNIFSNISLDGQEAIRSGIGYQTKFNVNHDNIHDNYFTACNGISGNVETISFKTGLNVFSHNTVYHCKGSISLRFGSGDTIINNYYQGGNIDKSSGFRISGYNHYIANNYVDSTSQVDIYTAMHFLNGLPDTNYSRLADLDQARNITTVNNVFYSCKQLIEYGYDFGNITVRILAPAVLFFNNNIFSGSDSMYRTYHQPLYTKWTNNFYYNMPAVQTPGLTYLNPALSADSYGVYRISAGSPAAIKAIDYGSSYIGSQTSSLHPVQASECGVNYSL